MKDERAATMAEPRDIRDRAMEYGLRAIRVYRHLLKSREDVGRIIGRQFLRSATSIGANLVEAQSGESRRDFIHKCGIAQKEARESKYWLTLLRRSETLSTGRLSPLIDETDQLIAILTRIIINAKKRVAS
jgi:four helix bundle protein